MRSVLAFAACLAVWGLPSTGHAKAPASPRAGVAASARTKAPARRSAKKPGSSLVRAPAESPAPVIEHAGVVELEEGADLVVIAKITSAGGVAQARLFARLASASFVELLLAAGAEGQFRARVPVPTGAGAFEYYLSATDARSLAETQWRSREAPQRVRVVARSAYAQSVQEPSGIDSRAALEDAVKPADDTLAAADEGPVPEAARRQQPRSVETGVRACRSLALQGVSLGAGVDPKWQGTLEELVLTALTAQGRVKVLGQSDLVQLLGFERQKQLLGCDAESSSCLAEISGALGVDCLASANLGRLGGTRVFTIKVIDVRTATVVARALRSVADDSRLALGVESAAAEVVGGTVPVVESPPPQDASLTPPSPVPALAPEELSLLLPPPLVDAPDPAPPPAPEPVPLAAPTSPPAPIADHAEASSTPAAPSAAAPGLAVFLEGAGLLDLGRGFGGEAGVGVGVGPVEVSARGILGAYPAGGARVAYRFLDSPDGLGAFAAADLVNLFFVPRLPDGAAGGLAATSRLGAGVSYSVSTWLAAYAELDFAYLYFRPSSVSRLPAPSALLLSGLRVSAP